MALFHITTWVSYITRSLPSPSLPHFTHTLYWIYVHNHIHMQTQPPFSTLPYEVYILAHQLHLTALICSMSHRISQWNHAFPKFYISSVRLKPCLKNMKTAVYLTHWGRVAQLCVSRLSIIGSDNGLSPGRRAGIIWTNARIFSLDP